MVLPGRVEGVVERGEVWVGEVAVGHVCGQEAHGTSFPVPANHAVAGQLNYRMGARLDLCGPISDATLLEGS